MIATALVTLSACELPGTMVAYKDVKLVDKKGNAVPLQAGMSYKANIEKEDDLLEIEVEVAGKTRKIRVKPAPGQQIPEEEGTLSISAAQSGQPVDMVGTLNTEYDQGPEQYGQRQCWERVPVRVCGTDNQGHYHCWIEYRQVAGYQDVRYHNVRTTRTGDIQMVYPGQSSLAAQFNGRSVTDQSVITWEGRCRINGYPY